MSDEEKVIDPSDAEPTRRCREHGLHPLRNPLVVSHHTDVPFSDEDKSIGNALAYFLGTLFADVDQKGSRYFYYEMTSVDQWRRVARALRIHGLAIVDRPNDVIEGQRPQIVTNGQVVLELPE
jgi:hypothetical protein